MKCYKLIKALDRKSMFPTGGAAKNYIGNQFFFKDIQTGEQARLWYNLESLAHLLTTPVEEVNIRTSGVTVIVTRNTVYYFKEEAVKLEH